MGPGKVGESAASALPLSADFLTSELNEFCRNWQRAFVARARSSVVWSHRSHQSIASGRDSERNG